MQPYIMIILLMIAVFTFGWEVKKFIDEWKENER